MRDERRLAVHRISGANDVAAEGGADALVPEAHAEDRRGGTEAANDFRGDTGFGWRARSRRDEDVARCKGGDFVQRHLVAPADDGFLTQLAHVACEVVDERVVVVEDENHGRVASASIMARALSSVSRYSCSGSESATMPPPALKYTRPSRTTAVRMAMLVSSSPVTLQ